MSPIFVSKNKLNSGEQLIFDLREIVYIANDYGNYTVCLKSNELIKIKTSDASRHGERLVKAWVAYNEPKGD